MPAQPRFGAIPALLLLAACSGGSTVGPPTLFDQSVDPQAAATLSVESGPFEGLRLEIPAGALPATTRITGRAAAATTVVGALAVGPAVELDPAGTAFDPTATLILPFDVTAVPAELPNTALVATGRDAGGNLQVIAARSVDRDNGLLTVEVSRLSTYWATASLADARIWIADYAGFDPGARFLFEGGVRIEIDRADALPNLAAAVITFTLRDAADNDLTIYFQFRVDGLYELGMQSLSEGFQNVRDTPYRFVADRSPDGAGVAGTVDYTGFEPVGSPTPGYTGSLVYQTTIHRAAVDGPTGRFDDAVELRVDNRFDEDDGQVVTAGQLSWNVWLARGVGPVAFKIGDSPVLHLVQKTQ